MQAMLPGGWQVAWSTEHQQWYYFNLATGQRQWNPPPESISETCHPQENQQQQHQCTPHDLTAGTAAVEPMLPPAAAAAAAAVPGSTKSAQQQQAVTHAAAGSSSSSRQRSYWYYDPHGRLLGPFTLEQLTAWRPHLPMDLKVLVKSNIDSKNDSVVNRMHGSDNPTASGESDRPTASSENMKHSAAAAAAAAAKQEGPAGELEAERGSEHATAAAATGEAMLSAQATSAEVGPTTVSAAAGTAAAAARDAEGTAAAGTAAAGTAAAAAAAAARISAEQQSDQHTATATVAAQVDGAAAAAAAAEEEQIQMDAPAETASNAAAATASGSGHDTYPSRQGQDAAATTAAARSTSEGDVAAAAADFGVDCTKSRGTDCQQSVSILLADLMGDSQLLQSWKAAQQQQQQLQQHSRPVAPPAPVWEAWCARYSGSSSATQQQQQQQYAHHAVWQQFEGQHACTACPHWGALQQQHKQQQQQQQQHALQDSLAAANVVFSSSSSSKASSSSGFSKYAAAVLQGLPPDDEAVQLARMAAVHGYKLEDVLQQSRPAGSTMRGTAGDGLGFSGGDTGVDQGLAAAENAGVGVLLTKDPRSGRLTYAGRSSSSNGSGAASLSESRKMAIELYGDLARWCNPAELERMLHKAKAKKQRLL